MSAQRVSLPGMVVGRTRASPGFSEQSCEQPRALSLLIRVHHTSITPSVQTERLRRTEAKSLGRELLSAEAWVRPVSLRTHTGAWDTTASAVTSLPHVCVLPSCVLPTPPDHGIDSGEEGRAREA